MFRQEFDFEKKEKEKFLKKMKNQKDSIIKELSPKDDIEVVQIDSADGDIFSLNNSDIIRY